MMFDTKVPRNLKKTQEWFGSIISRPIDEESRMNPISPSGVPMEKEAAIYIAPSPTLRADQRIQIYNQQYWWRLLNTLHEILPLVTRLFGYHDFNQLIGIPYLTQYPPSDWTLINIGDHLPQWIDDEYHASDKELILNAAKVDCAFNLSFLAPEREKIDPTKEEDLISQKLTLQPFIHLFEMDCNLFEFRNEFVKQSPEYWIENDFPNLLREKQYYFVLYRNRQNDLSWKEISEGEYHLLRHFQLGTTIESICQWLESQPASLYEAAASQLHVWFQEWTVRGWLTPAQSN